MRVQKLRQRRNKKRRPVRRRVAPHRFGILIIPPDVNIKDGGLVPEEWKEPDSYETWEGEEEEC